MTMTRVFLCFFSSLVLATVMLISASSVVFSFSLEEANGLHADIYEILSSSGVSIPGDKCDAVLIVDRPRGIEVSVSWSGECDDGLAHGDGDLTLLYDAIPMFTTTFSEASGSVMHRGVPLSTLSEKDFSVLQSACKDGGWRLGNVRGGTFAEYPATAVANYWTFAQDAMIAEQAANCGRLFFELRVLMMAGEVVGVVRGTSYTERAQTLKPGRLRTNLYGHADIWNQAVDNYNREHARMVAENEAKRAADFKTELAARYADQGTPIDNLADFLVGMGEVKAIGELSSGRFVVVRNPDISFVSGVIVAQFYASPTSAKEAVEALQQSFSWDKWFDVTLGGDAISSRIAIACRFAPGSLDGVDTNTDFVVHATLEQLQKGSMVLNCRKG
jgi:hypothetical protein